MRQSNVLVRFDKEAVRETQRFHFFTTLPTLAHPRCSNRLISTRSAFGRAQEVSFALRLVHSGRDSSAGVDRDSVER